MERNLLFVALLSAAVLTTACSGDPTAPSRSDIPVQPPAAPPPAAPPAAPPLMRTVRGLVVDLEGAPLAGVKVVTAYGVGTLTDGSGAYALAYPVSTTYSPSYVTAGGDDYEPSIWGFGASSEDVQLAPIRVQRKIFVDESAAVSATISALDLDQWIGEPYDTDLCEPCKVIRLRSSTQRKVRLDLSSSGGDSIAMWTGGTVVTANPILAAAGETVILVGVLTRYGFPRPPFVAPPIPFTLSVTPQ